MPIIDHLIVTGQSLSVGGQGTPPITTAPEHPGQVQRIGSNGLFYDRYEGSGSGGGGEGDVETVGSQLGGGVFEHTGRRTSVNVHGVSGTAYTGLKKGTATYSTATDRVAAAVAALSGSGNTLRCAAVHVIHGETDEGTAGTTREQYALNLAEWQADYDADLRALTGQTETVKMIVSQMSSWTSYGTAPETSPAMLDAHRANRNIVLVGPKYHLPYADYAHLTNVGYFKLGEHMAEVHNKVVADGGTWHPVAPTAILRSGATIVVDFWVPVPPLVFDTTTLAAQPNMGFVYRDDENSASIQSVAITGPAQVTITLNATPAGTNEVLKYGAHTDTTDGRTGNLRDSSTKVSSYDGGSLANWCCQFIDPVGFVYTEPPVIGEPVQASGGDIRVMQDGLLRQGTLYVMADGAFSPATLDPRAF